MHCEATVLDCQLFKGKLGIKVQQKVVGGVKSTGLQELAATNSSISWSWAQDNIGATHPAGLTYRCFVRIFILSQGHRCRRSSRTALMNTIPMRAGKEILGYPSCYCRNQDADHFPGNRPLASDPFFRSMTSATFNTIDK